MKPSTSTTNSVKSQSTTDVTTGTTNTDSGLLVTKISPVSEVWL